MPTISYLLAFLYSYPWGDHADTERGCARIVASADLRAFARCSSSSWARFRRAIFCLRSLLNLDLSPFRADIWNSWDWVDRSICPGQSHRKDSARLPYCRQSVHKDLRMAARHQHLSPEYLQIAVKRLDDVFAAQDLPSATVARKTITARSSGLPTFGHCNP